VSHPRISVFAGSANGNARATRTIEGQATLQARTNHQIAVDPIHDEIIAPNPFAQAILFFRGGANGEEAPIRIIQGPKTKLVYVDNVAVDPIHGEVVASQTLTDSILVFSREPGGDVAPIRILNGPHTKLDHPWKATVDPVNNLIAVTNRDSIAIFNRTDNGDVPPKWIIGGPKAHAFMEGKFGTPILYPEGKKIFVSGNPIGPDKGAGIAVWKYGDNGDVTPWAVIKRSPTTRLTTLSNKGMAVNPEAKEVMVLAGEEYGSERILIYHAPELFQ
jgi:hypothetical protein